jgi:hypothetical protein
MPMKLGVDVDGAAQIPYNRGVRGVYEDTMKSKQSTQDTLRAYVYALWRSIRAAAHEMPRRIDRAAVLLDTLQRQRYNR